MGNGEGGRSEMATAAGCGGKAHNHLKTNKKKPGKIFTILKFPYLCLPKIFGVALYCCSGAPMKLRDKHVNATLAQLVEQLICNQ